MKTQLLKVNEDSIALGAKLIREGELVGFPTETVYGLGANALDARAVAKIFEAKGRPQDNPLITHVACVEEIPPLVRAIPAAARKLMEAFWPGPMTLILPKADCIPDAVSAGLDTVGIRLPANADARRLIRAAGCPIAAPSANRSGRPSPTTALHVLEDMDGRIPLILDGGACQVGVESSVIDATGEVPVILRPGGITPEMVERVLGHVRVDEHVMSPLREGDVARSPGMKYKHYAPKAKAVIFSGAPEHVVSAICRRYDEQTAKGERVAILGLDEHRYGDRTFISLGSEKRPQEAAARLFAALRDSIDRAVVLPEGYSMKVFGEQESQQESNEALAEYMPLTLVLILIVLLLLLRNYREPVVILLMIPLIFIGVVLGLAVTGKVFNFFSLLGLLGLVGMNIKNAVVLVEQIGVLRAAGKDPYEALTSATRSRIVPVAMASGTTILGMLPLLFDSMFGAMAATIMGGLLVATLLTVCVLPVVYALFYNIRKP